MPNQSNDILANAGVDLTDFEKGISRIEAATEGLSKAADKGNAALANMEKSGKKTASALEGLGKGLALIGKVTGIAFGLDAVRKFGMAIINTTQQAKLLRDQMNIANGDVSGRSESDIQARIAMQKSALRASSQRSGNDSVEDPDSLMGFKKESNWLTKLQSEGSDIAESLWRLFDLVSHPVTKNTKSLDPEEERKKNEKTTLDSIVRNITKGEKNKGKSLDIQQSTITGDAHQAEIDAAIKKQDEDLAAIKKRRDKDKDAHKEIWDLQEANAKQEANNAIDVAHKKYLLTEVDLRAEEKTAKSQKVGTGLALDAIDAQIEKYESLTKLKIWFNDEENKANENALAFNRKQKADLQANLQIQQSQLRLQQQASEEGNSFLSRKKSIEAQFQPQIAQAMKEGNIDGRGDTLTRSMRNAQLENETDELEKSPREKAIEKARDRKREHDKRTVAGRIMHREAYEAGGSGTNRTSDEDWAKFSGTQPMDLSTFKGNAGRISDKEWSSKFQPKGLKGMGNSENPGSRSSHGNEYKSPGTKSVLEKYNSSAAIKTDQIHATEIILGR